MSELPIVSVVIPAYNAAGTLVEQLQALSDQETSTPYEIIVVDNGSTDETAQLVLDHISGEPRLRLVTATSMKTPGYARNAGAAVAHGELLAFCDADDVVEPNWVETMVNALTEHRVVMGSIDYTQLNPLWLQEARGTTAQNELSYMDDVFPYIVSANLGVRRDAFEQVDGFDPQMRQGQDGEFAWRLFQAGIGVGFDDRVKVNYRLRDNASATFKQARNYGRARMELRRRMKAAGIHNTGHIKWRNILWLIRHSPTLIRRPSRYRWLTVAGNLWGEVRGPAVLAPLSLDE